MKVKICGLTDKDNVNKVLEMGPDFIGFIFYKGSKRAVNKVPKIEAKRCKKVGVFVNAGICEILNTATQNNLDFVQLHGEESPQVCTQLKKEGIRVIKAIPIGNVLPKDKLTAYDVDMILFDTAGALKGGNGYSFDWQLLQNLRIQTPFMIGGGLDYMSISKIKSLHLPNLIGLDFNSRLEDRAGIKNINKVKQVIDGIRN